MGVNYENMNYDLGANVDTLASIVTIDVRDEKSALNNMYGELNSVLSDFNFLTIDIFARYIASNVFKDSIKNKTLNITYEDIKAKYGSVLYKINEYSIIEVEKIIKRAHILYNVFTLMVSTDIVLSVNENSRSVIGHNIAYSDSELKLITDNILMYQRLLRAIYSGMKVLCGDKE